MFGQNRVWIFVLFMVGVQAHREGLIPTDHGVYIGADRRHNTIQDDFVYLSSDKTFDHSCMRSSMYTPDWFVCWSETCEVRAQALQRLMETQKAHELLTSSGLRLFSTYFRRLLCGRDKGADVRVVDCKCIFLVKRCVQCS